MDDFITRLADTGLYHRVQGDLTAAGIIHRIAHKRFWLFRMLTHTPTRRAYPVRARSRIRRMIDQYRTGVNEAGPRALSLTGLVTALKLTRHLYEDDTLIRPIHDWLHNLITHQPDTTFRDTTTTITNHRKAP